MGEFAHFVVYLTAIDLCHQAIYRPFGRTLFV
ncbi:hypothetical protein EMIT0357P_10556 [Pseudomonas marginalis]